MRTKYEVSEWEPFAWRQRGLEADSTPYTEYRFEDSKPLRSHGNVDFEIRINVQGTVTGRLVDKLPAPGSLGQALEWLKMGKSVARKAWARNSYLFLGSCSPNSVVSEAGPGTSLSGPDCTLVGLYLPPDQMILGWTPNTLDLLALDWVVVD